ncbi:MAG: outer membrane protein assembly factor BamD [Casimicrobiaceae bacterium]
MGASRHMSTVRIHGRTGRAGSWREATWRGWLAAALVALFASGCNLLPEVREETASWSAERLYSTAHDAMLEGNYTRAVKLFETLEARYPYGRFAQQAILEGAFSSWRAQEPAAATAACDRFIRTYPNHPNVDYAYFLKGLVYFREDQGLFGYVYELDLAERDPKQMRESFAAFKELIARFPDSRYAEDAKLRMRYLSNAIGRYEVNVARYYYKRGAYVAAANRAQAAIVNTPQTTSNEEALDVLMKSYDKLGLKELSDDARTVLAKTYPDSVYVNPAPPRPWWKFW